MQLDTVIFDLDGLLIDSEPLWLEAGTEVMANYGKKLTAAQYETTVGLRTKEWIEHWFRFFSIPNHTTDAAVGQILSLVEEKIKQKGTALPGVEYIFQYFTAKHFKIGLATSSPMQLANVVVDKLGIRKYLQVVTSAEKLPFGKPHPQVYMECAEALGSHTSACLCFEDSFNGMTKNIIKERNLVSEIHSTFLNIEKHISEVASVSEENSASTEEIFAEIEEQNHKIKDIQQAISELDNLCVELEDMLH